MPFDSFPERDFNGGDPWCQRCKSCKQPIAANEPIEHIRLDDDQDQRVAGISGAYHAECARPFLSVIRALNALTRFS